MFIVTIDAFSIKSAASKDAKKTIDEKYRTPDILRGEARYQTAREEEEYLSIENGLSCINKSEILKINK